MLSLQHINYKMSGDNVIYPCLSNPYLQKKSLISLSVLLHPRDKFDPSYHVKGSLLRKPHKQLIIVYLRKLL